jgi:hypothetical protein
MCLLLLASAGSSLPRSHLPGTITLTGEASWPAATSRKVVDGGGDEVVNLQGLVPTAVIGPAIVRNAYQVVRVDRSASVGHLEVRGIEAQVTDACIRAHADVVLIRNTHCTMTGGPQVRDVNMPFGLHIASAKQVLIEDSSFNGFQWRAAPDRYWNGEGVTIERPVADAVFRRVTANNNTDAGFDVKAHVVMSDVSAEGNCRNFRFWSGADVGTLTAGDTVKRGGSSSCEAIWLSGSSSGPRPRLHISKLVVRMTVPGTIIEVQNGPVDIQIDECDIDAPEGTSMIRFEATRGELILGRGCEVRKMVRR